MKLTVPTLKVALLGCGSVGSQVARLLTEQADDLALRIGARLELAGIAVRRVGHPRAAGIDRGAVVAFVSPDQWVELFRFLDREA